MTNSDATSRDAYAECQRLARRHYENFPTASLLVPRKKRDALAVIYAFARYADDVADEPGVEGRLEKLAEWRQKLAECYVGAHRDAPLLGDSRTAPTNIAGKAGHPVSIALRDAAERFHLSQEHFENLLRAFERDVLVNRHKDFQSLLSYCTCSANPVGRLVLELFGHRDAELFELSDYICTALQLTNFWQDVAIDLARDRIYMPLDDMERFGYSLHDLHEHRTGESWTRLMKYETARTWELFEKGKPLPERVRPELQRQLRLTWLGGTTILKKIEAVGYDVFRYRPKLSRWDYVRLYVRARRPFQARATSLLTRPRPAGPPAPP